MMTRQPAFHRATWPLLSYFFLTAVAAGAVDIEVSPTGATSTYGQHHARPRTGVPVKLDRKLQKLALLELHAATGGPRWEDSIGWTTSSDPCQWYGVRCAATAGDDVDGTLVTHLKLPANKLNGTIPDIFGDLPHLRVLDLSLNYLKGAVPASVGQLPYIEKLDLGYNYLLLSLKSLAGLRTLESLSLRWNTLVTGSLEDIAGSLKQLKELDLRDNKMTSLTAAGLANMPSLRTVHLEKSGLHGTLDLAAIRHLDTFIASGNRLEGVLRVGGETEGKGGVDDEGDDPSSLNMFHRLVTLDLANNMLEGRIPRLPGASQLTTLTVQNNNFEGSDFRLRDHPRLEHVDMSGNMLLQPFPVDFFRATNLVKFLCANCGLTGVLALPNKGVSPNPDLEELVLFNNELFGTLPDALWNFPSLRVLDLSNNQFFGAISPEIGRLEHLEQLELASNRITGALPDTMSSLFRLHTARLEHNMFSGALPTGLFDRMRSLQVFAIHGNMLDSIPDSFPAHVQTWPLGLRAPASTATGAQKEPAMVVLYGNQIGAVDGNAAVSPKSVDIADDDAKVYRVCGTMNDFFHNTLVSAGWLRTEGAFFHASYGKCYGDSDDASARSLLSMQRASRFPYVGQLSDKGLLTHNIEAMRKLFPDEYSFYPRSFTIPAQLEEYKRSFSKVALTLQHPEKDNLWLMKPRARCCGEGIRIINKAEDAAALVDPDLGEWYTQRFVSPPALIDGHKFVFRLFAVVTSFSPLRVQLFHDGLIFYTFTPYTVANQTAKRSYISDYFFTDKQTDYFLFTQDYIESLRQMSGSSSSTSEASTPASVAGGKQAADKLWADIKAVVVKSLVAGASWTARMQRERTHPGTVYEIFGYDIVLDNELNPFLCEINETPNMGLEVNYHSDYSGLGAEMERGDYDYKTRLMDATLSVANVEPRYTAFERVGIREDIVKIIEGGDFACFAGDGDAGTGECLSVADLSILVDLEAELRRGEVNEYDQVFPCVDCGRYFDIMRHTNLDWGDILGVWWMQLRKGHVAAEDGDAAEPTRLAEFLAKYLPPSHGVGVGN